MAPRATIGDEYATAWARKKLADAIRMVTLAPDGVKHDTLIDAGRLAGGVVPLVSESEIETALFAAIEGRAADKRAAIKTIRDGIRMGMQSPLPVPPPPPQPVFDADNFACCPVHQTRLDPAKNGNGYKCRQRDATTASGWCDFWWKGEGYIAPEISPILVGGEVIQQSPILSAPAAPRYVFYKLSGLRALPPVEWLIPGEIPAGLTTIVCGASGAGKSFLMVDYAIQVARANPDRAVVYIAPEGGAGYHMRTEAWLQHFGGEEPQNLVFLLQAVPILNPQAVSDFITSVRPMNPVMVIIDTLARCLVGGDENSAKDVGMFFYHTDMIRQETGAAITIVHHTGKSGSGYRGSSVLYGSVESWIDVSNDDGLITVACGKSKDAKPFPPRYLRMMEVGDSVVLLPADQVNQRGTELSEGQRKVLETLALDIFTGPGAKRAELVSASGISDVTMYKVLSRLKRDGLITQSKKGDPYFISTEGLSTIRSYHRQLRRQREIARDENSVIVGAEKSTNYHAGGVKDFQEDDSNYQRPNAQLSQLSSNYHELSSDSFHQLSNYTHFPPSLEGGKSIVGSEKRESDSQPRSIDMGSDLFPDGEPQSSPVPDMVARLKSRGVHVLDSAELKQALADSTDTTISSFTDFSEEDDDAASMA
jgi:predicted transcriptional regulator